MTTECFAPAKINLTLHVTGQRADGYHLLESLVVFADVGDHIRFTPAPEMTLDVSGPFADGVPCDDRNLVWKAAALAGVTGHISLEKNLPHGAGIGGGSSDAGALLRGLKSVEDGLALGADVPVCRLGQAACMSGIGEVVRPVTGLPELTAVLVNPGTHLPTPPVFNALQSKDNPAMTVMPDAPGKFEVWLRTQRNDLEAPACAIAPVIGDVLAALVASEGQTLTRMSGSGATCFALFADRGAADTAADRLAQSNPDWWIKACSLS